MNTLFVYLANICWSPVTCLGSWDGVVNKIVNIKIVKQLTFSGKAWEEGQSIGSVPRSGKCPDQERAGYKAGKNGKYRSQPDDGRAETVGWRWRRWAGGEELGNIHNEASDFLETRSMEIAKLSDYEYIPHCNGCHLRQTRTHKENGSSSVEISVWKFPWTYCYWYLFLISIY